MNTSQKSRKPPPVPSFQQSSLSPKPPSATVPLPSPLQLTTTKQPQITDKKKPNLSSINQKLANMMKNKKDLIEKKKIQNNVKPVEEKKNAEEELYHPAFPNHYEEIKHLYDFGMRGSQSQIHQQMIVEQQPKKNKQLNKNLAEALKTQEQEQQIIVELSQAEQMALKIMQKCGFKVGQGLGKNSQGITTPIVIKKTTDATCVVIQSTVPMDQIIKPQISARIALQTNSISPSNIIVLPNITTLSQLNQQIQTQIRAECQKYGNVLGWISYLINNELRIFVEYENNAQAFQAFVYLNQRYYDNKLISVRFYNPTSFKDQNYSQQLHPHVSF